MKSFMTLLLVAIATLAQAQHKETRKISAITGLSAASSLQVILIQSDRNEVVVESENPEHIAKILTEVTNGVLHVKYKPNTTIRTKSANQVKVFTKLNLSSLKVTSSAKIATEENIKSKNLAVDISSSGKITLPHLTTESLSLHISSSGKFEGNVQTTNLDIKASSSSKVTLSGKADKINLEMSSSASIDLSQLKGKYLTVDGGSSSSAKVNISELIKGSLSSSAKVIHAGSASTNQVSVSSSAIISKL